MKPTMGNTGWSRGAAIAATTVLCLAPLSAQSQSGSTNPWNPYPVQQGQSTTPASPKPKYYTAPSASAPTAVTNQGPSRFAPADLDQRLSTGRPLQQPAQGYGVQNTHPQPFANPPASFGPFQGGYPQGYSTGAPYGNGPTGPPGYGGFAPPMGNNGWGGGPNNNSSPFGFW